MTNFFFWGGEILLSRFPLPQTDRAGILKYILKCFYSIELLSQKICLVPVQSLFLLNVERMKISFLLCLISYRLCISEEKVIVLKN